MSPDTEPASCRANGTQGPEMTKFPVSDGTIEKVTCHRNALLMEFTDWQENSWLIIFEDLIAFQGINAIGAEVCDMYEQENSPLSNEVKRQEVDGVGISYCFTSSNGGDVIFEVIAGNYSAEQK